MNRLVVEVWGIEVIHIEGVYLVSSREGDRLRENVTPNPGIEPSRSRVLASVNPNVRHVGINKERLSQNRADYA